MNILLNTVPRFRLALLCGGILCALTSQAADRAGASTNSAPPSAASVEVAIPKSVFVDDLAVGRDPFFPKSARRVKAPELASGTNAAPVAQPTALLSQLALKLNGVSNAKTRRLALINGTTFEAGELADVKVGSRTVKLLCREIRDSSVLISLDGANETRELKLREGT